MAVSAVPVGPAVPGGGWEDILDSDVEVVCALTPALFSAVPGLGSLEVVTGLLQIVWFLWFGILTTRTKSTESPLVAEIRAIQSR